MKKTLATTIRCDAREAAELVLFFNSRGVEIANVSDLLRQTIKTLSTIAKTNNLTHTIETTEEAVQILRENGVIDMTVERKNRNFRTLVDDLQTENLVLDGVEELQENEFAPDADLIKAVKDRIARDETEARGLNDTPNVVEDENGSRH